MRGPFALRVETVRRLAENRKGCKYMKHQAINAKVSNNRSILYAFISPFDYICSIGRLQLNKRRVSIRYGKSHNSCFTNPRMGRQAKHGPCVSYCTCLPKLGFIKHRYLYSPDGQNPLAKDSGSVESNNSGFRLRLYVRDAPSVWASLLICRCLNTLRETKLRKRR